MSVELDPAELGFKRPFTQEVSQVLRLSNPHSQPVAFKVKTTAPKQYCVRPNSGRIEASSNVEVQVLLQAMKEDPPLDAKCRDKFLVQSVVIPDVLASNPNIAQVWQGVETTSKGSIQEKKIRVSFLPASGAATSHGVNGVGQAHEQPPAYSSQGLAAVTPQKALPSAPVSGADKSPSLIDQSMASVASASETVQNTAASAASAVVAAVPTSSEQLQRQLDEAKATIVKLQQQATEGLRQRKVADSTSTSASSPKLALQNHQVPGGVSVQIVAALCLLSFLIAYLFF